MVLAKKATQSDGSARRPLSEAEKKSPGWQYGPNSPYADGTSGRAKKVTRRFVAGAPGVLRPPKSPMERLQEDLTRSRDLYLDRISSTDLFNHKSPQTDELRAKKKREKELRENHDAYAWMMVASLGQPLKGGVSAEKLVESISMGVAMWALSPAFRHKMTHLGGEMMDKHRSAVVEKIRGKLESGVPRDEVTGLKWRRRLKLMDEMDREGHAPFTEYSAAITRIGMDRKAYEEMREPGLKAQDVEAIRTAHSQAVASLYEMADHDGLEVDTIDATVRSIAADMSRQDPASMAMYTELAHCDYGLALQHTPAEKARMGLSDVLGRKAKPFIGFVHYDGAKVTEGSFSVRGPMGADDHRAAISQALGRKFIGAKNADELQQMFFQQAAVRSEVFAEKVTSSEGRRAVDECEMMFAAMEADGIDEQEREAIYVSAFMDATQVVHEEKPVLERAWVDQHGASWGVTLNEMLSDPKYTDAHFKDAPESTKDSGTKSTKKRSFRNRRNQQAREQSDQATKEEKQQDEQQENPEAGSSSGDWDKGL